MNKFICNEKIVYSNKNLDKKKSIEFLREMLRIRKFEEKVATLVEDKKITTPCHLYIGQEAVAVGVCSALNRDDYVFGTHRSHGHYLAKGGDLAKGMAEIFCKSTGCSKGRGGSMHLISKENGILGTSSIVAGSVPLGVGAALAEKIKGTERISVVFHGDGVPEEGVWNESLNFAAIKDLPVLFICENNFYCTHLALHERRVEDNIPELARAHGVPSQSIDGNNVLEVYNTVRETLEDMRENSGPRLIECRTYRWLGHVGPKDNLEVGLRSQEEVDSWKKRCPIKNFENFLTREKVISVTDIEDMYEKIDKEIDNAVKFAEESPYPDGSELYDNVFKSQ